MTQALVVLGGLFVLIYGPLALLAWRRPLLARFAFREATRRRGQFALLVVGLMVGSASITASLVAAESVTASAQDALNQRLGAVDLTVTASGGRSFPADVAQQLAADPALKPYADGVQAGLELPASVTDVDQRLGKAGVLLVGFDPASQQRFGAYLLADGRRTYGTDLGPGDVLLSSGLASALDARPGDQLRVSSGSPGGSADLRVYGVASGRGPGGYGSHLAIFLPLATAQQVAADPGINVVRVAARGGTAADLEPARRAAAPLGSAVSRITAGAPLTVNQIRIEAARGLEAASRYLLGTTLGVSLLSVLAAVAMIVNLILALAEERRPRLAVMRALGLTRAGLVALGMLEGWIYSLAAATAGIGAGILLGLDVATRFLSAALVDPTVDPTLGASLQLAVRPGTLAVAFAASALITLGTIAVTAFRTSRMAIAAAIRDLPEPAPPVRRAPLRTLLLLVAAVIGVGLLVPSDPRLRLAGGVIVIATVAGLARGRLSDQARVTLAGLLVAAWAAIVAATTPASTDLGKFLGAQFLAIVIAGVSLCITAVANLKVLDGGVGLLGNRFGRIQAVLRPPLAYVSRRPVRTALTTSGFSAVLVIVTLVAEFVAAGQVDHYARDSAGFDIQVVTTSSDPIQLPSDIQHEVIGQMAVAMRVYQGPYTGSVYAGAGSTTTKIFYVMPDEPQADGPLYLSSREKRFTSDADVWRAVRTEPDLVIGEWGSGIVPGDAVTVMGINGQLQLRVAASPGSTILNGLVASKATLAQIATRPAGSTVLLKLRPGVDPRALAREIGRALYAQGVEATPTRDIIDQDRASGLSYVLQYDTLLHLGLAVGVLALVMVLIRAAIERRRMIGILRALGYQPPTVVAGLLTEALIIATIGTVTGVVAGLLIGYFTFRGLVPGEAFGVDLARLGVALAIIYGTVLVVTVPLAARAGRIPPAAAVRIIG